MESVRASDSSCASLHRAGRSNGAVPAEAGEEPHFAIADAIVSSKSEETLALMPSNLRMPPKKWGIPHLDLRVLSCLVTYQFVSAVCNIFSASSAGTETQKGLSPAQIENIRKDLQPGDIMLSRTPTNEFYYALQKSAFGSEYSHASVYTGNNRVIDAYEKVNEHTVQDFCASQGAVLILRPRYPSEESRRQALDYLETQLGKPYDWKFNLADESAHYCTEIVVRALEKSSPALELKGKWFMGKPVVVPDDFLNTGAFTHIRKYTAE